MNPFKYRSGNFNTKLAEKLKVMYGARRVYLFSNARSAEYLFLKSLDLPIDSEVVVQAFTCNAVVNPILWLKHRPVYVDINPRTYGMDLRSFKEKVGKQSKVAIVQHTFGINGLSKELLKEVRDMEVYLLEDCAHSLGNSSLGSNGDAAIVSFGIEKVLSTRVGGALIVHNPKLIERLDIEYGKVKRMGIGETFVWLLNPIIWRLIRPLGLFSRTVSLILNRLGLLNMGFYKSELKGIMPFNYPRRLSSVLSKVVLDQLSNVKENLSHREEITNIYSNVLSVPQVKDIPTVRFPFLVSDNKVLEMLKSELSKRNIYYGDWYMPLIYPTGTSIESMGYRWGECPVAEEVSRHIINLPTGLSVSKSLANEIAKVVSDVLKRFG